MAGSNAASGCARTAWARAHRRSAAARACGRRGPDRPPTDPPTAPRPPTRSPPPPWPSQSVPRSRGFRRRGAARSPSIQPSSPGSAQGSGTRACRFPADRAQETKMSDMPVSPGRRRTLARPGSEGEGKRRERSKPSTLPTSAAHPVQSFIASESGHRARGRFRPKAVSCLANGDAGSKMKFDARSRSPANVRH